MNSGERNIFFNFPGYYGHGVPGNYCHTNESSLVQNISKNEEAKKQEPKQKATREKWSTKETQVFVSVWKKNFVELQSYKAPDIWREISTKVSKVGNGKSVKQWKLMSRNMKASYHDAKLNNDKNGNKPNFPPFYEDFESILGCRDAAKVSEMAEIGCKTSIKKDEIPIVKNSTIKTPEQSAIKEAPQQPSLKRKHNDDDDVSDLLDSTREFIDDLVSEKSEEGNKPKKQKKANFHDQMLQLQQQQIDAIKEANKKNRKFMKDLLDQQRLDDMRERDRDRDLFMNIAKLFAKD